MRNLFFTAAFCCSMTVSCQTNTNKNTPSTNDKTVGGRCEGCEAIYESPVSFERLNETDTLPGFNESGPRLEISGIVYKRDGITPAAGVILYVYHTDQKGNYTPGKNAKGWEKRHGYIRGWIKTNDKGEYKFYTQVPASYPDSRNPKHIHATVKEPGYTEYWIEEFVYDDDPLLPLGERSKQHPRCGSGVLKTTMNGGMLTATRNIILGLNIENYPGK